MSDIRPQYFTQNALLATALHMAGVPFANPAMPCGNVYTVDKLKELRCESAREALRRGLPGIVLYAFDVSPRLHELLKAWDAQQQAIKAQDDGGGVPTHFENIEPEEVMRVACQVLKNRKVMVDAWRKVPAEVVIPSGPNGACKLVSVNASEETRRQLGL